MDDRFIDIGIRNGTGRVQGTRKPLLRSERDGPDTSLYRMGADQSASRLVWAATGNTYFTCTIAPLDTKGEDGPHYVAQVSAVDLDGDLTTSGDVTVRFVTTSLQLFPGDSRFLPAEIYLGEKDPVGLKNVEPYAARDYYFQIKSGFGMCTFGFLVELMIWLLNTLYLGVRDYGVAIIILVLIVRTLLHPITKKGQVNMVKMQKRMGDFAPKLEEIKKKYGNDKAKLQQETMRLYREEGINPAGQLLGCLPLFLQMPIWVALYLSLSNNIRMRHEPFLFTWVHDLTAQDALYAFSSPLTIPLVGWQLESFNLLPLLMALFMYIQTKSQPRPEPNPNMSEQQRAQQEMMQKMMPMMSIMMLIFFYKAPSGLNLYIMFSSMFGWIEQKRIRAHIKEQEAAGTLLKPKVKSEEPKRRKRPDEMSFLEKLQKMAEDAQKARPTKPTPKKGRR
jgi:YidC/Oxa1 family membrane protein insertase